MMSATSSSPNSAASSLSSIANLEEEAKNGDLSATVALAHILMHGKDDVTADFTRAVALYEKAVEGQHPVAIFRLATILHLGYGVEKNCVRAEELYERAIKLEYVDAYFNLGILLRDGALGVPSDPLRAKGMF